MTSEQNIYLEMIYSLYIETPILRLLDQVKFRSLWWLKANKAMFVHGSQRWWSDPLLCLSLD